MNWQEVYAHMKSKKNPLKLSSSEYRNLTKNVVSYIFGQGQMNSSGSANHSAAIHVLKGMMKGLKSGGERYKALEKAIDELQLEDKKAAKAA